VIRANTAACSDVYVYFKHEEAGKGPQFARLLLEALGEPPPPPQPDAAQ